MSYAKPADTSGRDVWTGHIDAWLASQLLRCDHCRAHGLKIATVACCIRRRAPHALTEQEQRPGFGRHQPLSRAALGRAVWAFGAMHGEATPWSGFPVCERAGRVSPQLFRRP